MSDFGQLQLSDELAELTQRYDHLDDYLSEFKAEVGEYPTYTEDLSDEFESHIPNVLYRASELVFVHIYGDRGVTTTYYAIEPKLTDSDRSKMGRIRDRLLDVSANHPAPSEPSELPGYIDELLEEVTRVSNLGTLGKLRGAVTGDTVQLTEKEYERIRYYLNRDIAGLGALDPVMKDTNNEDIHVIGSDECFVDHGVYGMLPTNISFGTAFEFDSWLRNMGERINNPVSDSDPIIDSTLPDGSRINIIYSDDISIKGPSFTVRQGEEVPLSILQITKWGTLSPQLAAYLWLCLENERSVFVVGETASGKTTTLNSIMSFIPRDSKIYTAEDTAEVQPPHDTWQQLLTRESPDGDESSDVDLFNLVESALRSRPDYIIVGEVRGPEAQMAFQAAQTGHPVMLTFHAADVKSLVQRMTGNPINVPETFMDNADVALFQNRVKREDEMLRRVTSVAEFVGYNDGKEEGEKAGVVTKEVFKWDSVEDEIEFTGINNSYVLEDQIAELLGYENKRDIYDELERRTKIIERLIESDILQYGEANEAIETFQRDGIEALPIDTSDL